MSNLEELKRIESLETCSTKCFKNLLTANSIPEQSCFDRCTAKFASALKYTNDVLKNQKLEINKLAEAELKAAQ